MDYNWAQPYPEIHKLCTLFSLEELRNPLKFNYKPLPGIIQEGPQCGLVALAMCSENPSKELVEKIFQLAKGKGYTNNGEMFSAVDMADLAGEILHLPHHKISTFSETLDSEVIKEFLLKSGNLMLVPFDSEIDNSPGRKRGTRAHWAVVSGAIETSDDFYVIARHGKIRNVAIWKLSQLSSSNAQLYEVGLNDKAPGMEFKLPEGGLDGPMGLNRKSVLIEDLNKIS